jgi:hypothetical protein
LNGKHVEGNPGKGRIYLGMDLGSCLGGETTRNAGSTHTPPFNDICILADIGRHVIKIAAEL